jgi:hypothetical protein
MRPVHATALRYARWRFVLVRHRFLAAKLEVVQLGLNRRGRRWCVDDDIAHVHVPTALKRLVEGPQIDLLRPCCASLLMQMPIGIGDLVRLEQAIDASFGHPLRRRRAQTLAVDTAIDHHMGNVNILRTEFTCETLRERAQTRLGGREGGKRRTAAQRSRGPGKNQRAPASGQRPAAYSGPRI